MIRFLSIAIDAFSAAIILLPSLFVLLHFLKQHAMKKKLEIILFAIYLSAVFSVTGIPAINSLTVSLDFNWIPFIDIANSPAAYIINTILNIILFIPMGFFLPHIWEEYGSLKKTAFMGFGISTAIEVLQIFTLRLTDIDDLITNTMGTVIGWYLSSLCLTWAKVNPRSHSVNEHSISRENRRKYEPFLFFFLPFLSCFLLRPLFLR